MERNHYGDKMEISGLTIFLIIITLMAFGNFIYNARVTETSHYASDKLYEMIMEDNGSKESRQYLTDTYDHIKNIELNQKNNTAISQTRFIMLLIFTIFSYKLDKAATQLSG